MQALIDKIKAARVTSVKFGSFSLSVKRPTDLEYIRLNGMEEIDFFKKYVVGWSGVKEIDLVPGGTDIDVPFDSDLFVEWIVDKPECWVEIIEAITGGYKRHMEARDLNAKKLENG